MGYKNEVNLSMLHCQDNNTKRHQHLSPTGDGLLHCHQPSPFLPDELIFQILLWLPVRSLLLFKCVCKSWKTLISTPQFAKTHLSSLTLNPSLSHQRLFSSHHSHTTKIVSSPMKSLLENSSKPVKAVEFSMEHRILILGSCNGLLCLFDMDQGYVKLWNPCIRFESKKSPIIDYYDKRDYITYHGFGYDHVNDEYKVVVVVATRLDYYDDVSEKETQIYTFGGNSWTTIKNFPSIPTTYEGKFVSGTLNWVIIKRGVSVILSFDLEKETYNEVLPPKNDGVNKGCNPGLGVLSNCLCVCFNSKIHWDIWLMKKYGVVDSWTRLTIIPHEQFRDSVQRWPSYFIEPFFLSGNSIVFWSIDRLVLYNLNNGSLDDCLLDSNIGGAIKYIYNESLVSPQL